MLFVFSIVSNIFLSILPCECSFSIHHASFPLPNICLLIISPCKFSITLHMVFLKRSMVHISVRPSEFSIYFHTIFKHSRKCGSICPNLLSSSMHLVRFPFPNINHSFVMMILSMTICLIMSPLALVIILIFVYIDAFSMEKPLIHISQIIGFIHKYVAS